MWARKATATVSLAVATGSNGKDIKFVFADNRKLAINKPVVRHEKKL
jgi:hypothetical protein